ncbi:glycosyltransferase family 2 protein [Flagellimonas marinaquae]
MSRNSTALCIFTFNRLETLKRSLASLSQCEGIDELDIHIFSDGPRHETEEIKVTAVRNFLKTQSLLRVYRFYFNPVNQGLANAIINGVSQLFKTYSSAIVLEDDLIYSKNFLHFMTSALSSYKADQNVYSISGYSPKIGLGEDYAKDYYFLPRASSWGWATWKDRWEMVDWEVSSYTSFKTNIRQRLRFARGGSDLPRMLDHQMKGKIDSWAIRFVYQQFLNQQATVYPAISKVKNIGIGAEATHTKKKTTRFDTVLDQGKQRSFQFEAFNEYDSRIVKSFRAVFSFWRRLSDHLRS